MHELSVIPSIVKLVNRHAESHSAKRIISICIAAGELRDFEEEWVQRYFERFSKGTISEGANIVLLKLPIEFTCKECGAVTTMTRREFLDNKDYLCGQCGFEGVTLTSGRQMSIDGIEVEV